MGYLTEEYRTRVILAPQATGTAGKGYVAPTPGVNAITVRAIVNIGNATALTLSLNSADDTSGTNAVAYATNVPIFVNSVRQVGADNNAYTVPATLGTSIVDFLVHEGTVPQGKTIGLSFGVSNAANLVAAEIVEDTAYDPTVS